MVAFDAELLKADPAKIALGDAPDLDIRVNEAVKEQQHRGAACQAALSGYRTALMFRVLFTALVFAVSLTAAAALVYSIAKIMIDGVDLSATVTGISGLLGSGAAIFLGKKMTESVRVARQALKDVGTYCGAEIEQRLR